MQRQLFASKAAVGVGRGQLQLVAALCKPCKGNPAGVAPQLQFQRKTKDHRSTKPHEHETT